MQTKIYNLLRDFVAVESISCTRTERQASVFIRDYFAKFSYFQAHPEHFGIYDIPDDPYDRTVPYAFLKCILQSPAASDAFPSGRSAEQNGRHVIGL